MVNPLAIPLEILDPLEAPSGISAEDPKAILAGIPPDIYLGFYTDIEPGNFNKSHRNSFVDDEMSSEKFRGILPRFYRGFYLNLLPGIPVEIFQEIILGVLVSVSPRISLRRVWSEFPIDIPTECGRPCWIIS